MESRLYGFLLNEDIQLDIAHKRLVRYCAETADRAMIFKVVTLNEIQLRLLLLLLGNKPGTIILKNDIMENVWKESQSSPSDQRLWYLIKGLRNKLASIGISEDFVSNAHGIGYFVGDHNVLPIFAG